MPRDLFPGFASHWIDGPAGKLFARAGGEGPPVLLLHGFPESHAMWHRLAPALAQRHTVVATDLRGYGWSAAPRSSGGALYAKRAMGEDAVAVMAALGHARFALAGHDRGARVGYRLALDQPGRLTRLALLDILPTVEVWRRIRAGTIPARHWAFLSGPEGEPEAEIARGPDAYFENLMRDWSKPSPGAGQASLAAFDPEVLRLYRAAWGDPSRIHAMCEDYRAGATLDLAADEADLAAGRRIACPVLALTSDFYLTGGDPTEAWRASFAPHALGAKVDAGHFLAEENPAATLDALAPFLAGGLTEDAP